MLIAVALLRQHIPVLVGSAMAVAVVLLVVYGPGAAGAGVGIVLTLSSVAARALYTVLTRRLILEDASVSVVLLQQVAALGPALLVSAVVEDVSEGSVDLPSLTLVEWLGAVGLRGCVLRLRVLALPHRAAPQLGASGWFLHHPLPRPDRHRRRHRGQPLRRPAASPWQMAWCLPSTPKPSLSDRVINIDSANRVKTSYGLSQSETFPLWPAGRVSPAYTHPSY
jgi:hypothetical protein